MWRLFAWALCAIFLAGAEAAAADVPAVAAASDLKFALEEVAARFKAETGRDLRLSFGSSGNFARQIEQGAPFQLFLSADESYVARLAGKGLTKGEGVRYARGRLAFVVPKDSRLVLDESLGALSREENGKLAIANPEHAPYGRAAEEALRHLGLWERVKPRLILGENVSQAFHFAIGGSAAGGLAAYSLVLSPGMAERTRHVLIPEEFHRPLDQRMVLLTDAGETAARFYEYLQSPPAREILARYGFR